MGAKLPECQIVVCGTGGQGILFLTRILDEAAIEAGQNVISSETHGMAMRGGSVISCVRIGTFKSPLVRSGQADVLLVLAESELSLNIHFAKKSGAQIYVNTASKGKSKINADAIAQRLGSIVLANLVLLGFAAAHPTFPILKETFIRVLHRIGSPKLRESNIKAFNEGYAAFRS